MTALDFLKMYAVGVVSCFAIDLVWLGVVAKGFYQRQIGHLMRPDVQWLPAVLFYLVYVAALVVFVAAPAAERQSVGRAIGYGAFFGLAAYAAFDLTGLALLRDFPVSAALVDMAWGASLSAAVSAAIVASARAWS
ncbi:MAG TPA: DUF2177 family protein [Thermoanaerobaculia bacterium]|nr:DUF2177 family protein [Thermoanaerobaculia bacterium]